MQIGKGDPAAGVVVAEVVVLLGVRALDCLELGTGGVSLIGCVLNSKGCITVMTYVVT